MLTIEIIKDFRNFKTGTIYNFDISNITIIVGRNTCGKSSLFHALRGFKNDKKEISDIHESDFRELSRNINVTTIFEKIFYYDSIKDDGRDFSVSYDAVTFIESGAFHTKDKSHGETSLIGLSIFLHKIENIIIPNKTLLVFDEIDKGFDVYIMSIYYNMLLNIVNKYKVNIIAITHNPFVMVESKIVYNFNKQKNVDADEYIAILTNTKITKL